MGGNVKHVMAVAYWWWVVIGEDCSRPSAGPVMALDGLLLGKNMKDFDLFSIETHSISFNPHGLRVKHESLVSG